MYTVCEIVIVFALWIWQKLLDETAKRTKWKRRKKNHHFRMVGWDAVFLCNYDGSFFFSQHHGYFTWLTRPTSQCLFIPAALSQRQFFLKISFFYQKKFATHFMTIIFYYKATSISFSCSIASRIFFSKFTSFCSNWNDHRDELIENLSGTIEQRNGFHLRFHLYQTDIM